MHTIRLLFLSITLAALAAGCSTTTKDSLPAPNPATEPAPPPPAPAPPLTVADAAPTAEGTADGTENGSSSQSLQEDALESCERARELLETGETESAIVALDRAYELLLSLPETEAATTVQAQDDIRRLVAELLARCYPSPRGAPAPMTSLDLSLAIVDNEHVRREIASFTGYEREAFTEAYRRSGLFRPMILAKLEAAGLPSQLSWLPLVESLFKERALSRAAAVGLWQFIASTGQRYGLTRTGWVDLRMDPERSTDAAIAYLTELHGMFGDWQKALAAYNCGEARVDRLQRRNATEYLDFWDLYALLPQETRRYVPRFFATLVILADPARYGMTLPDPLSPRPEMATVRVEHAVQLDRLDGELGLAGGTLKDLNPALRHGATPPQPYDLRVPASVAELVPVRIAALPAYQPPRTLTVSHRVRRGETLSIIAARYGTSVEAIMRANRIRSAHRIWPGQRLEIPTRGGAPRSAPPATGRSSATVAASSPASVSATMYTVQSGDTLSTIARRSGVSVATITQLNSLTSDALAPGQVLRLRPGDGANSAASVPGRRYQVRSGDTPSSIADAHKVKLEALLAANQLSKRSKIFPGQWLAIPD